MDIWTFIHLYRFKNLFRSPNFHLSIVQTLRIDRAFTNTCKWVKWLCQQPFFTIIKISLYSWVKLFYRSISPFCLVWPNGMAVCHGSIPCHKIYSKCIFEDSHNAFFRLTKVALHVTWLQTSLWKFSHLQIG